MNVYVQFAKTAARQRLVDRAAILGRMGFYVILLFIFSRLWEVVLERAPVEGIGPGNFVWYIAITEWIVLSNPLIHTQVEQEFRNGDLVYRLTRPVPYPAAKLAEAMGDVVLRLAVLGVLGFFLAWAMTGEIPLSPGVFAALLPVGLLAAALGLVFHFIIGLSSFWIHDCRPLYWIWQKAGFVLGGLLVPLSLYPEWLRSIAIVSPFAAMLHGPGRLALGAEAADALPVAAKLLGWLVVAVVVLIIVYRRALRGVTVGGG